MTGSLEGLFGYPHSQPGKIALTKWAESSGMK